MNYFSILLRAVSLLALVCVVSCTRRETRKEGGPSRGPEFRVRAVQEASLNGLDVLHLNTPADMDLARRNLIISGYVNKQLPLRARVQLNAYNPGLEPVALSGFDYTVLIDGRPLGKNRLLTELEVPAGDSVRVPVSFEFNTYKYLGEDAMPALRNFALGFGDPHRRRIMLQVRPLLRTGRGRLSRASQIAAPALALRP
jgi:hypothetical protein